MRELQLAAPTGPLDAPDVRVPAADLAKLCVHSLPEGVTEDDLKRAFTAVGGPAFSGIEGSLADKKVRGGRWSCWGGALGAGCLQCRGLWREGEGAAGMRS